MSLKLVRRPKSPNWIIRGTIRGISVEETTGTTDKKIATVVLTKRQSELFNESIHGKIATVTFVDAALDYLDYGNGEKRFLKRLVDHFQAMPLRKIGQDEIDKAAQRLYPRAGPATRNRQVYTPVSVILHHAARKGWCSVPTLSRPKQPRGTVRWIKPDEADKLIDACADHLRPLVVFLLYTGARAGEALWLDWANVDLAMRQVTFPRTKNGEARSVALHGRVIQELNRLVHRDGAVFRTQREVPYEKPNPANEDDHSAGTRIRTAFQGACRRAGINNFTPHCCRHTWATWHYQANHDIGKLQALGGWKSTSMVMRYAHTNVSEHAASIDNLPWGNSGAGSQEAGINETGQ